MRKTRRLLAIGTTAVCLAGITPAAVAEKRPQFTPGATGIGDPYFSSTRPNTASSAATTMSASVITISVAAPRQ